MAKKDKIIIYNFTDPVCTWCLGMEPVFRKLELSYPETIEIRYIMGGLVRDFREMIDPHAGIRSGDEAVFNKQVAKHWEEASFRHGMPVKREGFSLFSIEYPSTYPQNIAYKAAYMVEPKKADLFLYNMRTAVSSEGRIISREDVQLEIAEETGLNTERFLKFLRDGSAEAAFEEDLQIMRKFGVRGFPSFILEHQGVDYSLHGFHQFVTFQRAIEKITEGRVKPKMIDRSLSVLTALLKEHPKMAAEELRKVFDFESYEEVKEFVYPLIEKREAEIKEAGNGWFVYSK